jgi:hypothetical protein
MHTARLRRNGTLERLTPRRHRGQSHHSWAGDAITYNGAHLRVRSQRGPAKKHSCVDCGAKAKQWSYTHTDPAELNGEEGAYSADPGFYVPRCVSCHKKFDLQRLGVSQ